MSMKLHFEDRDKRYKDERRMLTIDSEQFASDLITAANRDSRG